MLNWLRNLIREEVREAFSYPSVEVNTGGTMDLPGVRSVGVLNVSSGGTVNLGGKRDIAAVGNHVVDISSLSDEGKKCFREYANAQWEHMNKPKVERSSVNGWVYIRGQCLDAEYKNTDDVCLRRKTGEGVHSLDIVVFPRSYIDEAISLLQAAKAEIGGGDG